MLHSICQQIQQWPQVCKMSVFIPVPKDVLTTLQLHSSNTPACKELTNWKRPWCWEGFGAGGEANNRWWDGWIASLTWWIWVLSKLWELMMDREVWHAVIHGVANSGHDWVTELNWTEHASQVMLKLRQARLQKHMTHEIPDVQVGFRKRRGTRDQISNIQQIIKKGREFHKKKKKKNPLLLYWLHQSLWLCGSQQTVVIK